MVHHELVLHDRVVDHLRVVRDCAYRLLMDCMVPGPTGQGDDAKELEGDPDQS